MKKVTYKKLADAAGVSKKQLLALACVVSAESPEALVDQLPDLLHGADTGLGLVYYNQSVQFLKENRKVILELFDEMMAESVTEECIPSPVELIMEILNKGLRDDDRYQFSEVVRTLVGGYRENSRNDPDSSGQVSWAIYKVWFEYLVMRLDYGLEAEE